jgi:hypothetical protein
MDCAIKPPPTRGSVQLHRLSGCLWVGSSGERGKGQPVLFGGAVSHPAIQVFGFCPLIVVLTNDHSTAAAADAATFPLVLPPPLPSLPLPLPLPMLLLPPLPLPPQLPPLLPPLLRCRCAATLGCAFRPVFRFIPVLIFRNSGFSAEFPDSGGTHIGIKSFQGKIKLLRNSGGKDTLWCILCHV